MKILKKCKDNKAATMTDVIVGLLIIILFTGILTSGFVKIYKHNILMRLDAYAVSYAIKILEDTDRMTYDEVTEDLNEGIEEKYEMLDGYNATITVSNDYVYNESGSDFDDLIKRVIVTIEYDALDDTKSYTVEKLKIKEM